MQTTQAPPTTAASGACPEVALGRHAPASRFQSGNAPMRRTKAAPGARAPAGR